MNVTGYSPIIIDPAKFGLDGDFISEAWDINNSGTLIVGTVVNFAQATAPAPADNLGGKYVGFTLQIPPPFLGDIPPILNIKPKPVIVLDAAASSAVGCNDLGDVVGFYRNANNKFHGFYKLAGRDSETYDPPGADFDSHKANVLENAVLAINNQRIAVGTFRASTRELGYVVDLNDHSRFLAIDMNAELNDNAIEATKITGINSQGTIIGAYRKAMLWQPFKWQLGDTPKFHTIGPPNTNFVTGSDDQVPAGINDLGEIVGYDNASNANKPAFGFLWQPVAPVRDTFIIPPASSISPAPIKTLATGISSRAILVGAYRERIEVSPGMFQPRRRAFIASFPPGHLSLNLPLTPFYPPTPVTFPPNPFWGVWNAFYGAQSFYRDGHNAAVGLLLNEIISTLTDPVQRAYLRTAVLEMVSEEVRKLQKRSD